MSAQDGGIILLSLKGPLYEVAARRRYGLDLSR